MTTTYVPLKYAKKAMREVREESLREGERRGYARATEFVRMASSLNGSTHAVLKALQEEGDGLATPRNRMVPVDGDGAAVDGAPDGDLDAVLMAALDALTEAKTHHPETDGGPVYAYLAGLLADPEALADALAEMDGGEVVGKSFDESKHPRGDNGRFIGREQIHAAKSDPKLADELRAKTTDPEQRKKLEAALKGDVDLGRTKAGEHRERVAKQRQDRAERVKRAQELANEISMWRRGGEAVPASHFRELAEVLPSMTVAELRSVRGKLAASFGGERRKSEMAARLLEHAKNKAALLETNERYEDMDALDFGSLDEYQNEGNAKGNEARNPNPEEQHGGRMQQRHDLMGAGAKGELQAPGKLSHGTPDTGSVLKLGDKPAPPPQTEPSKPEGGATVDADRKKASEPTEAEAPAIKLKDRKPKAKPKTDTLYSHVVGAGGIDPKSVAFLSHYSGVNHAVENGLSRGLFKNGGRGLDQIVRELHGAGHISGADEAEATENLLEGLRTQGYSNHADRTKEYDAALEEYHRKQQEAYDAGHSEADVADAIRRGEEDARREVAQGASGAGREDGGDAVDGPAGTSDAAEPTGQVDTSFDFGELAPTSQAHPVYGEHVENPHHSILSGSPATSDTPVSPIPPDHAAALSAAAKHHRRMNMPGKPIPNHVVYTVPEHRNTGGQLIDPARINATSVEGQTGRELLAGKIPHYTIHGVYEFGKDGQPRKVEGGGNAESTSQFSPEQAIKVAADDVSKLRKPDVFRAVEWAPPEHRAAVVDHIAKNRPDLHEELNDVADELGIAKHQPAAASTFSDADFENGNMHEKKVGNARLQYGVNENTGRAELYSLRVPQKERGKGSAKQAMKEFLSEADRRGLPVELLASPLDKRTNLGKLVRFYESLGFKVVGRGNPAGDPKMIREPNGDTQRKAVSTDWDDLRAELKVKRGIVHDDGATGV